MTNIEPITQRVETIIDPLEFFPLDERDRGSVLWGWSRKAKRCKKCEEKEEDGVQVYVEAERSRAAACPGCGSILRNQDRHNGADLRRRKGDRHKRRHTIDHQTAPFLSIDGEGAGTNEYGQQNYLYMAASDVTGEVVEELFKDNKPLTTRQCLEFILRLPKGKILTGFNFDYDVTLILRDLPIKEQRRLFLPLPSNKPNPNNEERAFYTYWEDYAIQYIPTRHLMVSRRIDRDHNHNDSETTRTINFVNGYFNSGLTDVAKSWCNIDPASIADLERMKAARPSFDSITPEIKKYCVNENRYVAEAMHTFRDVVLAANIAVQEKHPNINLMPRDWQGPGGMASSLLASLGIPRKDQLPEHDPEFIVRVKGSFSAGRTEIAITGHITRPIFANDLNSAYAAAILRLPCPRHTRWRKVAVPTPGSLYFARITWQQPPNAFWGAFQIRSKFQTLFAPLSGSGWYFSPEIEAVKAAKTLGAKIKVYEAWQAECDCDCRLFEPVKSIYDYRKSQENDKLGIPIKLALNALYGKFTQRVGEAPYYDPIAGGLITSFVRSWLIEAIALDPEAVIMTATDAIYSTRPLRRTPDKSHGLIIDDELGHWKEEQFPDLFIVQPGIYWSPTNAVKNSEMPGHKTRGIPQRAIVEHAADFYAAWDQCLPTVKHFGTPTVTIPYTTFIPLRLSLHPEVLAMRGIDPATTRAGQWLQCTQPIRFNWRGKRRLEDCIVENGYVKHWPYPTSDGEGGTAFDGQELDALMAWQNETEYAYPDIGYSPSDFLPTSE